MEFTENSESSSLVHLIRRHFPPTIQHSPQPGAGEETNLNYCLEFIALIIRVSILLSFLFSILCEKVNAKYVTFKFLKVRYLQISLINV